ncbi:hypothetical protein CASFOL_034325 [Castilleja foliolosa]|uniref:Replication factor A C-terminal domain-containing protein n=1 Tax=Castilleja foliolosa TaxID=1961234 RepID=A0ABD3BX20_9LAMI
MTVWSLFKDLHAGSTTWGLKVRIVRIHKQTYANSSNAGTMEMGDRIHASMYLDVYEKFKEHLVEGGLCRMYVSNFWVEATIIDIETKTYYWYLSCKNCAKKIYDDGNIKKCWTCNEQSFSTTYRYKIIVSVLDHTGTSTFLLWNRECAAIIGKSAGEMRDLNVDGSKQGDKMVEDALLDKKILFEVRKQTDRNNNNKTYFIVNRIVLNENILEIYRQNLITDNESTTGLTSEMNNKSLEMIEESSRNKDDKGKGIYLEDEDINEKGNADEDKQVALHEENPETDDADGAKSPQTSSESVADDQIKPRRVSDATTDATYMLKRKRIKKEK